MRLNMVLVSAILLAFPASALPQADNFTKNFKQFKQIAKGIDFFAATRDSVTPFEKPVRQAHERMAQFLGTELAPGAIVLCTTLEQRDTVNEQKVLRLGFRWVVIQLTPEASAQETIARIKAQSGGQVPAGILQRMQNQTPEMKAMAAERLVTSTVQRMSYAMLTTTFAPDKPFRSSRIDDVARSPMADWLDVGLVSYAAGGPLLNLRFLQEHLEEAYPLEDVIVMSRPFVAPGSEGSGGGGMFTMRVARNESNGNGGNEAARASGAGAQGNVMMQAGAPPGMAAGAGQAQSAGGGGGRGGRGGSMSKDVQDRMNFDGEAAAFFAYVMEKKGLDKLKDLAQASRDRKDVREMLLQPEFFGPDIEKTEFDWQAWVKAQKPEPPGMIRISGPGPKTPPQPNN